MGSDDSGYYLAFMIGLFFFFFFTTPDRVNLSLSLQWEAMEGCTLTLMSAGAFCKPFVSDLVVTFGDLLVTPLSGPSSRQYELILEFRLTILCNAQWHTREKSIFRLPLNPLCFSPIYKKKLNFI